MRTFLLPVLAAFLLTWMTRVPAEGNAPDVFVATATKAYGETGRRAAEFLLANAPDADKATLSNEFLASNLSLAMEARNRFPWARAIPEALFFNDVLPYATLDEPRDPWRKDLLAIAAPIVKDCRTSTEAAQALNRELFQKLNVRYSTARQRPNQSPAESIAQGKASCTGLSILLVDACRAVGIPARIAGTPQWAQKPGNHTWVEIWDGDWHFTGAAEYSPEGLDRAWFVQSAAEAHDAGEDHGIYASSWQKTSRHFPLAWAPDNRSIPALVVTERYARPDSTALSKAEAARTLAALWAARKTAAAAETKAEVERHEMVLGDKKMRWLERTFGTAPPDGCSLWISMHGGGGAPARVNDQQWQNQIRLYEPAEGLVVAPRAPTDTWDLWHQRHLDPLFDRLIAALVANRNVNPNKVYLLGYSAGGDGVYQLGPRMADRWAAAAMMAGHPNEARPLSLRNLPFFIFSGADDKAYNRNRVAAEWGRKLDVLHDADPGGYVHKTMIYEGLSHWMNGRDAEALPWMAACTRQPWPKKVIWFQDDVVHDRFYWLALPADTARTGQLIRADVQDQTVKIESSDVRTIILRLSDALLDLDQPVTVVANGKTIFAGCVPRTALALSQSLKERADTFTAASAHLDVAW